MNNTQMLVMVVVIIWFITLLSFGNTTQNTIQEDHENFHRMLWAASILTALAGLGWCLFHLYK